MTVNLKELFFSKLALFILTSMLMGIGVAGFWYIRSSRLRSPSQDPNILAYPQNLIPLSQVQDSPDNFSFNCQLKEIIVKEIPLKDAVGEVFGICKYQVENELQSIALLLGYINKNTNTTFMSGKKFGVSDGVFAPKAFRSLAEQAGFVPGAVVSIIVTPIGHPEPGKGLFVTTLVGEQIDAMYANDIEKFRLFSTTGRASDLPQNYQLEGHPIVLPVLVELAN